MTISAIIADVAKNTGIPKATLLSPERTRSVVHSRQLAMWMARREGLSLTQIGNAFRRHHTTVLYAIRAVDARLAKARLTERAMS